MPSAENDREPGPAAMQPRAGRAAADIPAPETAGVVTHSIGLMREPRWRYHCRISGEWKATGDISAYDWGEHLDRMRAATARGVTVRRVRVISEPPSDYIRWEHACTRRNVEADIVAAFQIAWDRAIPHAEYKID
jgi:hypothetical protein